MKRAKTQSLLLVALILTGCNIFRAAPQATPSALPLQDTTTPSATSTPSPVPPTNTPNPTSTNTPIPVPLDYGPDNFPSDFNPLTGLPVNDAQHLERRPLAVKIQTFPRGQRPPWGASFADIVYDYYQNNGLTRLTAIFYSQDVEQAGPVRSARLFDGVITRMYKAIFAFGGGDRRILNRLFGSDYADRLVTEGNNNCPPICRIDPDGFNYLMANTKELGPYVAGKGVEDGRQDLNGMTYQFSPPANGQAAKQVYTRYSISSYCRWDYDPASGRYLRFQDTQEDNGQGEAYEPLIDKLTEQQIATDNVVILLVNHEFFFKSGNSEIIDILLTGGGEAYAFRDGQVYQVRWNRPELDAVLYLTYPDGTVFPYKQGTTWYQVVGMSSRVNQPEAGVWRFEFRIP